MTLYSHCQATPAPLPHRIRFADGSTNNTVPTSAVNLFPDGPDVVMIRVTNVSAVTTNTIATRFSWTEAQA
jgi:hypothetical protein